MFEDAVRVTSASSIETPQDLLIKQANPLCAEALSHIRQGMTTKADFQLLTGQVLHKINELKDSFDDRTEPLILFTPRRRVPQTIQAMEQLGFTQNPEGSPPQMYIQPPGVLPGILPVEVLDPMLQDEALLPPVSPMLDQGVPDVRLPFRMDRNVQTIPQLYREWFSGINGRPAVAAVEARYNKEWRRSPADTNWWSMRKALIEEIQFRAERQAVQQDVIVEIIEQDRRELKVSLDKYLRRHKDQLKARKIGGRMS